jgi:hypothetical protein
LEIPLNAAAFRGMVFRARGQKGKKKGGGDRFSGYGTFSSAALLFPRLSVGGAHHSAANAVSERNPLLAKALHPLHVPEARHLNNPTLRPSGRSVG